jgi:hypothetical protein
VPRGAEAKRSRLLGNFAGPLLHSRGIVLEPDNTLTGTSAARGALDLEGIAFGNNHDAGSCVQVYRSRAPSYNGRCQFWTRFRGLLFLGNCFGSLVAANWFQGSSAGRTVDSWDFEQAWGLVLSGHATAIENQFAACGTAAMLYGAQSNLYGGRIEVCGVGLRLGGPSITPGHGGQVWRLSRSTVGLGLSMESNYRNLWVSSVGNGPALRTLGCRGARMTTSRGRMAWATTGCSSRAATPGRDRAGRDHRLLHPGGGRLHRRARPRARHLRAEQRAGAAGCGGRAARRSRPVGAAAGCDDMGDRAAVVRHGPQVKRPIYSDGAGWYADGVAV